jgi:hypothetical protein
MNDTETAIVLIRVGVGIVQIAFGLSQQFAPEKWLCYIPGFLRFIMPIKPTTFMRVHSLGNLSLGLLLVSGLWMPTAIWLALGWWIWILPFAFYKDMTIGLRDFAIIMSLITLLVLSK